MSNPYVPHAWTDGPAGGTPLSAARLLEMEQGIVDAHFQPRCRVTRTTTQSIPDTTATPLEFESERWDYDGLGGSTIHDNTAGVRNRLVCRVAGVYAVTGLVQWATNATGVRILTIRDQAGTSWGSVAVAPATAYDVRQMVHCEIEMVVNDWVELVATQTSGGALLVQKTNNISPEFMMHRV